MTSLTLEIIEEILLRLPVRSLIRFKFVCKQWFSLITDPKFAKSHLALAISEGKYMDSRRLLISIYSNGVVADASPSVHGRVVGYYNGLVRMDYEFNTSIYTSVRDDVLVHTHFRLGGREVVGSCDGLICAVGAFNTFYLWNPSTGEDKTLPRPGAFHGGRVFYGRLLYGFGYDSSTHDYKMFVAVITYDRSLFPENQFWEKNSSRIPRCLSSS